MRFLRVQADSEFPPPGLGDLASGGDLDLFQLDYGRSRSVRLAAGPPALPVMASHFLAAIREVRKELFLEPRLRVVSSAGWADAYGCVEQTAQILVEGGCGDLPMAAVRGSNLLPLLEYLPSHGVSLAHAETGAAWPGFREPVLAADLELGAGPIATALAEGARVIIAGCYDAAAPAIAAAIHTHTWAWNDLDRLASAAAASHAAIWPAAAPWPEFGPPRVEIDEAGFAVEVKRQCEPSDPAALLQWLRGSTAASSHAQADVRWSASSATVEAAGRHHLRVHGCSGGKRSGHWRLTILRQTGYFAEALIEFTAEMPGSTRKQLTVSLRGLLGEVESPPESMTLHELGGVDGGAAWLHAARRSASPKQCEEFALRIVAFAAAHPGVMRLASGRPTVQAHCEGWPVRVPPEAVDIAVDTRPAKEWA